MKAFILFILCLVLLNEMYAQNDTLKVSLNVNANGVFQTGQTSRLVSSTLLDLQIKNRRVAWEHFSQYTFGTIGKPGLLPKTKLENEFLLTHAIKYKPKNRIFPILLPMYEFSNLRGVKNRIALSAGLGYNIINDNALLLEANLGTGYETNNFQVRSSYDLWRLLLRIKSLYKIPRYGLSYSLIIVYQPSLELANDIRVRGISKINFKAGKHLGLNLIYSYIFENIPDLGKQKQNSQLTYGISYNL